jgi:hypothetical protein
MNRPFPCAWARALDSDCSSGYNAPNPTMTRIGTDSEIPCQIGLKKEQFQAVVPNLGTTGLDGDKRLLPGFP